MKVIDLLNKIANGEEIKQFKYYGGTYIYDERTKKYWFEDIWFDLDFDNLNDEVEIINDKPHSELVEQIYNEHMNYIYGNSPKEDKKIEKIKIKDDKTIVVKGTLFYREKDMEIFQKLSLVINEIIDRLNGDSDE